MDNYSLALRAIQDSLKKTIQPIIEYQEFLNNNIPSILSIVAEQTEQTISSVRELNQMMLSNLEPLVSLRESIKILSDNMIEILYSDGNSFVDTINLSNILEGLSIQDDCVELSDSAYNSISVIFESNNDPNITANNNVIDRKMSINTFIATVLYPLLLMFIPMIQTSYYRSVDSLEEQRHDLKDEIYQEKMLDLTNQYNDRITELNTNINELLQTLQESQEFSQELPGSYSSDQAVTNSDPVETLSAPENPDESDSFDTPR